ncbi:hypothetical protein CBL_20505 [Carabus blaptoides fortunei]
MGSNRAAGPPLTCTDYARRTSCEHQYRGMYFIHSSRIKQYTIDRRDEVRESKTRPASTPVISSLPVTGPTQLSRLAFRRQERSNNESDRGNMLASINHW